MISDINHLIIRIFHTELFFGLSKGQDTLKCTASHRHLYWVSIQLLCLENNRLSDNFTFEVNMDVMLGEVALILWCNAPAHTVRLTRLLSVQVCGIGLLLPPKKLIGNMDRDFIAERQRGLQAYLDSVTQHPVLSSSLPVKKFLDSNSYSANYTGMFALYHNIVIYILSIWRIYRTMFTAEFSHFLLKTPGILLLYMQTQVL